jgi:hypothetical protein
MLRRDFLRQLSLGLTRAIPGGQSALSTLAVAAPSSPLRVPVPDFSPHKLLQPVMSMLFASSRYEQLLAPSSAPEKEAALFSFAKMLAPLSTWTEGEHDIAGSICSDPSRVQSLLTSARRAITSGSSAVSIGDENLYLRSSGSNTNDMASRIALDAGALEMLESVCSLCADQAHDRPKSFMLASSQCDRGTQALMKLIESILAADWRGLSESPLLNAAVQYTTGQFATMKERARLESTLKEHGFEPAKMDVTSVQSFRNSTEHAAERSVEAALQYLHDVAPADQRNAFPRIHAEDGWSELPPFIQRELWEVATLPAIPEATARSAKELLIEDPSEL